jgi:hypothetical protein
VAGRAAITERLGAAVLGHQAPDGRTLLVEEVAEGHHVEHREVRAQLVGRERPRHRARVVALVASARDDEQRAAGSDHVGDAPRGLRAQVGGQDLERVGLEDEVEARAPLGRGREHVGDDVVDPGVREAPARPGDSARRDVEGGDREAALGERLCVVAEAGADLERAAPGAVHAVLVEPREEAGVRRQVGPWHVMGAGRPGVELLEPPGGVAAGERGRRQRAGGSALGVHQSAWRGSIGPGSTGRSVDETRWMASSLGRASRPKASCR